MVLDNGLLNVLMVYAPHLGNRGRKKSFWNEMFHLVSCTAQNKIVASVGDTKGHVEVVMLATM